MPSPTRVALLLLLIALPLLEIAILIEVGQAIGFWPSVLLLIAAALVGAKIVHDQGLATARRAAEALAEGTPPVGPMLEGVALVLAGALLILPGYLSDIAGLLLMVPPFRRFAILSVLRRFRDAARRRFPRRRRDGRRRRSRSARSSSRASSSASRSARSTPNATAADRAPEPRTAPFAAIAALRRP